MGHFQNLNFESANLPPVPPGQGGGEVSSLDAIPGWIAFLGTNQVTQVLQNSVTFGLASIDILGPDWNAVYLASIIEGQYTVVLQPGADPVTGLTVGASISQTALVPTDAQAIYFKAEALGFSVTLGGQNLSIIPLGTGTNYTLYGANIPGADAGQIEPLTITALAGPNTTDLFDSFLFSSTPVPEPGVVGLSALGALVLGWRTLGRRR